MNVDGLAVAGDRVLEGNDCGLGKGRADSVEVGNTTEFGVVDATTDLKASMFVTDVDVKA
ncbi:MAG: hypothetical protein GY696_31055 [Gammaproteobacteria bacterium]|nr:hypothetical protein [Gammaproteobacteria bacterium]